MSINKYSKEFAEALFTMQSNLEGAVKDSANPHLKSKYADLASCWDACRVALHKAGLVVLQWPVDGDSESVTLRTELVLKSTGESVNETYKVPVKDKTNAQALGSSITYARRYALCSILGICPEDDDGHAASAARKAGGNGNQAVRTEQKEGPKQDAAWYKARFDAVPGLDGRKALFQELRNSTVCEPDKTQLLTYMSGVIKSELKKEKE